MAALASSLACSAILQPPEKDAEVTCAILGIAGDVLLLLRQVFHEDWRICGCIRKLQGEAGLKSNCSCLQSDC